MAIRKRIPVKESTPFFIRPGKQTFSDRWANAVKELNSNRRATAQRKPFAFNEARRDMQLARQQDLTGVMREFKGEPQ